MKKLTLPLKKKWFDMIKSGEKKEEYREINPYWAIRLFPKSEHSYIKECCLDGLSNISPADAKQVLRISIENLIKDSTLDTFDEIEFTLGYPRKDDLSRRMVFKNPKICVATGLRDWGAEKYKLYFVITWDE